MVNSLYSDNPDSEYYYKYYYDDKYNRKTAISKIDEENLKKIATDLKIDYIQMSKTSNINYKLSDIKKIVANSQSNEEKVDSYSDIYYYFAIPLVILIVLDFILKMRRM